MDKEQQRKEISRKICERCDYFDGRACTVNLTGECNLAKDSAYSILHTGYGKVTEFAERCLEVVDEMIESMWNNASSCKVEGCTKSDDILCGSSICVEENKQIWKNKILELLKEYKT